MATGTNATQNDQGTDQNPGQGTDQANRAAAGDTHRGLTPEQQELINRANRSERKRREAAERKAEDAQRQLDELKQSRLSDDEKKASEAIERAKKETADSLTSSHRAEKLMWLIERRLLQNGADPDASRLMDLKDLDPEDSDGLDEAVEKLLEAKPHLILGASEERHPPAEGFPRRISRAMDGGRWTRTRIREVIASGEYAKYKAEIQKAQAEGRVYDE